MGLRATLNGMWTDDIVQEQKKYYQRIGSRCSARVWLTNLAFVIQQMMFSLWMVRNNAIHKLEDSAHNQIEHREIDNTIDEIYADLPNMRLLPPCDAAFFGRGAARIKTYRLQRKKKWADDAKNIIASFRMSLDATSANFLEFFTNTST